jgi:hypothetical protein
MRVLYYYYSECRQTRVYLLNEFRNIFNLFHILVISFTLSILKYYLTMQILLHTDLFTKLLSTYCMYYM